MSSHWAGQAFALASSNDTGGRKSRIRRSKEERKGMVETFIKRYQKTNNGNFPSLNLTHKEVGGSFYTVREIVGEIIQENRVLAPPKTSLEEYDHSGFLEQNPLGSISIEPQSELVSERTDIGTHILPIEYPISSEKHIYGSSVKFHEHDSLEMDNVQIINGQSKVAENDEDVNTESTIYISQHFQEKNIEEASEFSHQLPKPKSDDFENETIVIGSDSREQNSLSDNILITNAAPNHTQVSSSSALSSSQNEHGWGVQRLTDEQYNSENSQICVNTKESGQQAVMELITTGVIDREKHGAVVEASQPMISHMNSNVVVETFPLRPVSSTIQDMDGVSGKLHEATWTKEDKSTQNDKMAFDRSSHDMASQSDDGKLPDSPVKLHSNDGDDDSLLHPKPSLESSKHPASPKETLHDAGDVNHLESKEPLPNGIKVSSSFEKLTSGDSAAVGGKFSDENDRSVPKGSNPTLDRINLETWEGASKSSARHENNPLLALVKAFMTAFVKFLTQ